MNSMGTAAQQLVEQGQQLVVRLATDIRRRIPFRAELDDLIAYGQVGLAEAARDFDERQGSRFITYAYYRIRGAIYDGVSSMSWTSRAYRRKLRQRAATERLGQHSPGQPANGTSHSDQPDQTPWLSELRARLAVVAPALPTDQPGLRDSTIADLAALAPPAIAAARETGERLRRLIDALPSQAARLIRLVYFDGLTLQQAAERLSVSRSWASRLHAQTLQQLARALRKLGEEDFRTPTA
jgi:RNA polymerase sigma factor for flagellar operon FliA